MKPIAASIAAAPALVKTKAYEHRGSIAMIVGSVAVGIGVFILLRRYNFLKAATAGENQEFRKIKLDVPEGIAYLYFVNASWCPHSKRATPEWRAYRASIQADPVKRTIVNFKEINADAETEESKIMMKDIKTDDGIVPAIRMEYSGRLIKFEGRITRETLASFVDTYVKFPKATKTE